MNRPVVLRIVALSAAFFLVASACGSSGDDQPATDAATTDTATTDDTTTDDTAAADDGAEPADEPAPEEAAEPMLAGDLVGLFAFDPTSCVEGDVSGTYFRMIQPVGALDAGPFVPNADSPCADQTYSALIPGSDGGLITGSQQTAPDPAFDDAGNGLATVLAVPVKFFGVDFALAIDGDVDPPSITATDGVLSGDMSSWSAYYANLVFNQGAPKPDGSLTGLTAEVTGVIDPETGVYTIEWSSQIEGGSFNDFTGVWHLEGTFVPEG